MAYKFTLKNINVSSVDSTFNVTLTSNLRHTSTHVKKTNLNDILDTKNELRSGIYSYIDESKKKTALRVTLIDKFTKNQIPLTTPIHCFWCKHSFKNRPIGCPIKFLPSILRKSYFSQITKEKYVINQLVDNMEKITLTPEMNVIKREIYLTDGIFCSFPCCLAFIKDNLHNDLYTKSENFLQQIFSTVFSTTTSINSAPHWRLLQKFGGFMSISQFKSHFSKSIFMPHEKMITMVPLGRMFEKKNLF